MLRVEQLGSLLVFPPSYLVEPFNLDDADCGREFVHAGIQPVDAVVGLAVVRNVRAYSTTFACRETTAPPSPVEIVLVAANDQMPASPHVPARRPCQPAPCA